MDYKTWLSGTKSQDIYEFYHEGPIIRGTIQEHSFKLPSYVIPTKLSVAYKQGRNLILKKDIEIDDSLVYSVKLSEIDTLKFRANKETKVQLKIETETSLVVSDKFNIQVENSVDDTQVTTNDEVYAIEAQVNNCQVKAYDYFNLVNGIDLKCKFNLDGNWKDFEPRAYFNDSYNHLYVAMLDNDYTCKIPTKIVEKPGIIHVGLFKKTKRATTWSNPIRLKSAVTFVPNNESGTATNSENDVFSFYYNALKFNPTDIDDLVPIENIYIPDILDNGLEVYSGSIGTYNYFACDPNYEVVKIVMEDTWVLTPPDDPSGVPADYTITTLDDFTLYSIISKVYETAKYTLYFKCKNSSPEPSPTPSTTTVVYSGCFTTLPVSIAEFTASKEVPIKSLTSGIDIVEGGNNMITCFAFEKQYSVTKVIMEDIWELEGPDSDDPDYKKLQLDDYNVYYIAKPTLESAKYTFKLTTNK